MSDIAEFYGGSGGLAAAIRAALEAAGLDMDHLSSADLAPVDEFHIRGRTATCEIADSLLLNADSHALDLGSGLGGPARTLVELTGCRVTGIDLTPEFCDAATQISEWMRVVDRVQFQVGDATATDLPDASFDAVLTVHVAMNIADKAALYSEAFRVLRPGGRFVVYDVLQGEGGDIHYPVPWATDASISFLATPAQVRELLTTAGFVIESEVDSSDESLAWFQRVRDRVERDGSPPVTFATFLGDSFRQMAANQVANLVEDRIRTVMFTCTRS